MRTRGIGELDTDQTHGMWSAKDEGKERQKLGKDWDFQESLHYEECKAGVRLMQGTK